MYKYNKNIYRKNIVNKNQSNQIQYLIFQKNNLNNNIKILYNNYNKKEKV